MIKIKITIKSCANKVALGVKKKRAGQKRSLARPEKDNPHGGTEGKALLVGGGCSRSRVGCAAAAGAAVTIAAAGKHAEHPQ